MLKASQKSRLINDQGFSLLELLVVFTIISTLLAIAGIYSKQWMDRYNAEGQIRRMHADLLQARANAMGRNKLYFLVVNTGSYQVIEDTNENGSIDPSPADTWQALNTLNYQVSSGAVTITIDQKGIISAGTTSQGILTVITFNTGSGTPEYDCMQLYATRINIGRTNGANCVPR